jgi:hypothetical protein
MEDDEKEPLYPLVGPGHSPALNHAFHESCAQQWFQAHGSKTPTCPTCRGVVVPARRAPEAGLYEMLEVLKSAQPYTALMLWEALPETSYLKSDRRVFEAALARVRSKDAWLL